MRNMLGADLRGVNHTILARNARRRRPVPATAPLEEEHPTQRRLSVDVPGQQDGSEDIHAVVAPSSAGSEDISLTLRR